eukprot:scaffold16599_cov58-Attheya_sp.AAC.3
MRIVYILIVGTYGMTTSALLIKLWEYTNCMHQAFRVATDGQGYTCYKADSTDISLSTWHQQLHGYAGQQLATNG